MTPLMISVVLATAVAVTLLVYEIFKAVNKGLALMAAFFSLVGLGFEALRLNPNGVDVAMLFHGVYCILAGYLAATSGSATIDDIDVFWHPVAARRRIGYMPENCPLYTEMRVREYLRFRGGIKGLPSPNRRTSVSTGAMMP